MLTDLSNQLLRLGTRIHKQKEKGRWKQEDIHHFRVTTKKLSALLNWISTAMDNRKPLGLLKPWKKLYQLTGEVRELQLFRQELLADQAELDEHLTALLAETDRELAALASQPCPLPDSVSMARLQASLPTRFTYLPIYSSALQFIEAHIRRFCALMRSPSEERMHRARKQLKELIYLAECGKQYGLPLSGGDWLKSEGRRLRQLADELGRLHDLSGMLLLSSEKMKTCPSGEAAILENRRSAWREEMEQLMRQAEQLRLKWKESPAF